MTVDWNRHKFDQLIRNGLEDKPKVAPRCRHFGTCGGCQLQDFAYPDQIAAKLAAAKQLFSDFLTPELLADYQIVPADQEYNYRVKMEYVLQLDKLGLRQVGNPANVLDLSECHLIDDETFTRLRQLHAEYLKLDHKNEILYFVVKSLPDDATKQMLVSFVTLGDDCGELISNISNVALKLGFAGVSWMQTRSPQIASGKTLQTWGETDLELNFRGKRYRLNQDSFVQNNLAGFSKLLDYVEPFLVGSQNIFDLYCGFGTIAIQFAGLSDKGLKPLVNQDGYLDKELQPLASVNRILGVEEVAASIELAKINAKLNNVENVEFVTARVSDFLHTKELLEFDYYKQSEPASRYATGNTHWDTIIVDPPRAGLEKKVCRRLQKYFNADKIIYISCNPVSQLADLHSLSENYQVVAMRAFDLFPQTLHMENVAILTKNAVN